jgi:probable HAF family extracellular repeat protein
MKSRFLMCFNAITLFAALAIPVQLAAQERQNKPQPRYKLIDIGTLGGPNSGVPTVFYEINGTAGARGISSQGAVTGTADTSTTDPLCYLENPPCLYPNAFQWQNGSLTSLGALPGSQWSVSNWVSGNGRVTGFSENGATDPLSGLPVNHGVLWQGGQIHDLGTLPGGYDSWAFAVNNRGRAVGFSTNGTADLYSYFYFQIFGSSTGTQTRAFLWDQQNGMQDLGTLGGPDAWAGLVNERGQVAGISYTSSTANANNGTCGANVPGQDPFFWDKDTGMIDIGTFGGTCGVTNALNNRGQVAGQSYLAGNLTAHAFLWNKRGHPLMKDLGTLGGDNASALWLNDAGDVVGFADLPNPPGCSGFSCIHHAFLWKHGMMTDLGSVGSDPCSRALSINSKGQIVGFTIAVCGGNPTLGFLWEDGGPMIDLNTLVPPGSGLSLVEAIYINDRGEIVGNGVLANGDVHAFLLIPCDEKHGDGEGCGEGSADAADTARVSPALADQNPAALTPGAQVPAGMNRLRSRWSQRNPASGTGPAPDQKQEPSASSVAGDLGADHALDPLWSWHQGHSGYCEVDMYGKLDGLCTSHNYIGCYIQPSTKCPKGQPATSTLTTCGGFGTDRIALKYPCSF